MNVRIAIIANKTALPPLLLALEEIGGNTVVGVESDAIDSILSAEIDLFIVGTSVDRRAEVVNRVLRETQAAVLCDTPMAMDEQEAQAMVNNAAGRMAWISHPMRFGAARLTIQQMLQEQVLGSLYRASTELYLDAENHENAAFDWRFDFTKGGGVLNLYASHLLDLAEQEHGEIISVLAHLPAFRKERLDSDGRLNDVRTDDYVSLVANTENGFMVDIRATQGVPGVQRCHSWYVGSKGALHLYDESRIALHLHGEAPQLIEIETTSVQSNHPISRALPEQLKAVLQAVDTGMPGFVGATSFEQGIRLQRILDATRGSAFQRMWNGVFHESIEEPIDLENPVL